jgi:enoyl-CoA hydratase/carnithine racemase
MCVGGGLELVLACDLIWTAASARLGQLEATIGTTTLLGGVQRLAERAGPSRAREIIYTAEPYDAASFERWNIVNRVVPDEALESETRAFAKRLASVLRWRMPPGSGWCAPIWRRARALPTKPWTR